MKGVNAMRRLTATGLLVLLLLAALPRPAHATIVLTSTSDLVQVVTDSAVVTIHVHASWADHTTTGFTPGRTNTQITTAATTTVVASPAASTQRQVKILTVRNSHASSSNALTIQHTDGTTVAQLFRYTLLAGETIVYDGGGFYVLTALGEIKSDVRVTTFPDNEPFNVAQFGGTNVATGTGASGAGVPRVTVANDSSVIVGTFPDNEPFNLAQMAGTAASVNAGNADAGTQRVAVARTSDVCNPVDTLQVAVTVSAAGNTELVALTSGQTIYVCDVTLVPTAANDVQLVYGTGTACATGETDMTGPMAFDAKGGWTHNYNGRLKTAAANALCIELSAATAVNGVVTYRKAATF